MASEWKNICRPFEVRAVSDSGVIEGHGSVFNVEDSYADIVAPGAFKRSLKEIGMPKMLWSHQTAMPIGVWSEAKEDAHGLYVKGQIAMNTAAGRDAYELMKMGALDGLSIGFRTRKAEFDDKKGTRTLLDVDLLEVSPVVFPANDQARVESVRCDHRNVRELEYALRHKLGLPKEAAKALLSGGFSALSGAETEAEERRDAAPVTETVPEPERRDAASEPEKPDYSDLLTWIRKARIGG